MARRVKCPGCGATGQVAPFDETFEARGGLPGGKSVAKCTRCGCGVTFGVLSTFFAGNPKLIEPGLWEKMQAEWDAFKQKQRQVLKNIFDD